MGVDLLLAHKDLVVVLDETASAVTREDVPGVGVGDGRLPAHLPAHLLPAHLLPAHLLPAVALLLLPVPLLLPTHLLPALLLAAVALLLAATVLHRHGGSRRHNWPHEQCRCHRQGEEERVQHAARQIYLEQALRVCCKELRHLFV